MNYVDYGTRPVTCPVCGGKNMRRRVPRVRVIRQMGRDLGMDVPPEYNEVVDRLERG